MLQEILGTIILILLQCNDTGYEGQLRLPLANLVKEADIWSFLSHYTVSPSAAIHIDFRIVTKEDKRLAIYTNKGPRERAKMRNMPML